MSEPFVYDSRCTFCKAPFGAVPCNQEITLRVRPLQSEGFTHCALVLKEEFARQTTQQELTCQGPEGDRVCFSITFTAPATPELLWYHFLFWRDDGSGCFMDRMGYRSTGTATVWQITVYDGDTSTPEWFGRGVTYQIFPDRFCRLSIPDPTGMVGDRIVHQDWGDTPDWRPDQHGEVRNRDFFGGSLQGVISKLDMLSTLSVKTLYFCPIFESDSNHRYNTADYKHIDPMLGTERDFQRLCREAHRRGMRVILDGVFNHTGSNSIYFNANGSYPSLGAAQSKKSPYYHWYHFIHWPNDYDAWWGIRTLPAVEEEDPEYRRYIIDSEDSVIRRWLRLGADGWRLDVADELPDDFIARIRTAIDETKPGAVLLGEVWEDGSNKIAYSQRRQYLLGHETHGLMNYPFRTAALSWLLGGDAADFMESMETIRENYPPAAFQSLMNFLGTHDTPRILTLLGAGESPEAKADRAAYQLSTQAYILAVERLKLAALLLYTFPGSPTVFYGDEAGIQGFEDPLNRGTYPWGNEDAAILNWYTQLGKLRQERVSLQMGDISYLYAKDGGLVFSRSSQKELSLVALNAGDSALFLSLPWAGEQAQDLLSGVKYWAENGRVSLSLSPLSGMLLAESHAQPMFHVKPSQPVSVNDVSFT